MSEELRLYRCEVHQDVKRTFYFWAYSREQAQSLARDADNCGFLNKYPAGYYPGRIKVMPVRKDSLEELSDKALNTQDRINSPEIYQFENYTE